MSQTDLDMEDAEKGHTSGPNQHSNGEVVGSVPAGGEKLSSATDVTSNGGDEVSKPSDDDEGHAGVDKPLKEAATEGNNEKLADMKTEDKKEAANRSTLEIEVDNKEEASSPTPIEIELKEKKPCVNPVGVVSDLKEAEDTINEDVSEKKIEEISKDIHDHVELAEGVKNGAQNGMTLEKDEQMEMTVEAYGNREDEEETKGQDAQPAVSGHENEENISPVETSANHIKDSSALDPHEFSTPNSHVRHSPSKAGDHSTEIAKNVTPAILALTGESEDGTLEEQAAFVKEVESFYRERSMDFKQPKFYGQPLNCLKLWRAVVRLGGYDKVTALKLWRQVGESFHPPKTCTTVSWTFRIFYEKSLLEFERQKTQNGELQFPIAGFPEAVGVDSEGSGYQASGAGSGSAPGRARRDSASRAMQGWHTQRLLTNDEEKNLNSVGKREKTIKSSGPVKQKRTPEVEHQNKVARTETPKQLATSIVDLGPPADWVKINVRQMQECFEVYALVPGLLREEVRVQSDPAGRVVITGQPEQLDNPWGITPFKKVICLPERIDPLQTSAVVSMHGRLLVRVPFEQPNAQPNAQA